jgi:hypothetical protein
MFESEDEVINLIEYHLVYVYIRRNGDSLVIPAR